MPDGAMTARRNVKGPSTYKGFEEERPGRIDIVITATTGNYNLLQDIFGLVASSSLLALQSLPKIHLGNTRNNSTNLHFTDFTKHVHSAELMNVTDDEINYYKGEVTLYLTGFISVYLTKRGGFSSKSTSGTKLKTKKITTKSMKRSIPAKNKK